MGEITVTVTGNVVSDVRTSISASGVVLTRFRLASQPRRLDRATGRWIDGETSWVSVVCFRRLAEHVASSVHRNEPVLVAGRLRVREWHDGERLRTTVEVVADHVGHDLARGESQFQRVGRMQAGESDVAQARAGEVPAPLVSTALPGGTDVVAAAEAIAAQAIVTEPGGGGEEGGADASGGEAAA